VIEIFENDSITKVLKELETQGMDVKQFYPSVDHEVLKQVIRRQIKDKRLLRMLDEIIDSWARLANRQLSQPVFRKLSAKPD